MKLDYYPFTDIACRCVALKTVYLWDEPLRQVEKRLQQVFLETLTYYQHMAPCVCQPIKVGLGNIRVGEKLVILESESVKSKS
jgi:hypothetical protein